MFSHRDSIEGEVNVLETGEEGLIQACPDGASREERSIRCYSSRYHEPLSCLSSWHVRSKIQHACPMQAALVQKMVMLPQYSTNAETSYMSLFTLLG